MQGVGVGCMHSLDIKGLLLERQQEPRVFALER